MVRVLWWAVVWLCLPARLLALDLTPEVSEVALGSIVEVYRDPTRTMPLDEIRQRHADEFHTSERRVPAFGFDPSTFWARFNVMTRSATAERWMLELAYAPMMEVTVHVSGSDGTTVGMRGGTRVPVSQRPWLHHHHVFPLVFQPGVDYTVYVSIGGDTSKSFPLHLVRHDRFVQDSQWEFMLFGAIFGIGVAFIFYNFLIWVTVRENAYLYYVVFTLVVGVTIGGLTGYTQLLLLPESTFVAPSILPLAMHLCVTTGFHSLRAFVGVKTIGRRMNVFLRYAALFAMLTSPMVFLVDYGHAVRMAAALIAVMAPMVIIILLRDARRGSRYAVYYLAAWGAIILGTVISALRGFGIIPSHPFADYCTYIGWSLMSILMSLGLAARMRDLKDENTAAIAQLVRNEKLASIGMMSAGVAHEINNPNNVIRLSIQQLTVKLAEAREFLLGLLEDDDQDMRGEISSRFDAMRQQAGLVSQGSERIGDIVNSMRSNSRKDQADAVVFDPVQGLLDTLTLVKVNWGRKVEFDVLLESGFEVRGQPSEMKQVFMNLLVNGCQAIEDRQKKQRSHAGEIALISTVVDDELHLVIQDNGCGMSESVRQRLFQPFFTTKGDERGTGLGVSICRKIVESHGGRLEVHSLEGEGSVFTVVLPLVVSA
jgi:signal transduction histidine kinase